MIHPADMTNVLVTGGAGFIGSNFVRYALGAHPDWRVTTLDKLTYAGRLENLQDVIDHPRHAFVKGDIADAAATAPLVREANIVVHFAAETHVDRSILHAGEFITTDVFGTFVLLEAAREARRLRRFVQISTDEVYGSVPHGSSRETDELKPRNPYAASKAGADRLAYSYWATYGVPVVITRASNNYGPYQFPEKVIPLFVTHALDDRPLPLYGDGLNERDWLHVLDHCRALDLLIGAGVSGEVYNIGGGHGIPNIDLTHAILRLVGKPATLIRPVPDRPGHDRRYSLDTTKLRALGWAPRVPFDDGLDQTVAWYRDNEAWWRPIVEQDGRFQRYYQRQYGDPRP
jgi:dTDP-glucose 4,6-dehydratase